MLAGALEIDGPKGLVDAYEVRIEIGEDFPFVPPKVFDVAERLPRNIDRHVYSDGQVCLEVWPIWRAQNPNPTVQTVLNGPIRNFFLSQAVFESSGDWPFGHYGHGDLGRREALRYLFRADSADDNDLLWRMNALVNPPRRQNKCPCRNGKLYRKCHRAEFEAIADILGSAGLAAVATMYLDVLERSDPLIDAANEEVCPHPSRE